MIEKNLQIIFSSVNRGLLCVIIFWCAGIPSIAAAEATADYKAELVKPTTLKAVITLGLKEAALLEDSLVFSVDQPTVWISSWKGLQPVVAVFDPLTQDSRKVYLEKPSFEVFIERDPQVIPQKAHLHMSYLLQNDKYPYHAVFDIVFRHDESPVQAPDLQRPREVPVVSQEVAAQKSIPEKAHITVQEPSQGSWASRLSARLSAFMAGLKNNFSDMIENTKSIGLRLMLAFGLGLLMSLTPCIYPMIPVTVGLLQPMGQSFARQVLRSIAYILGIATTFSLLGLLVVTGVSRYGALMNSPWFILGMVIFLGYLAFSMFDFYPMYIPRFLTPSTDAVSVQNTSLIAPFFFGIVTGTVASPCLSPGLMLLLAIVAKTESMFRGLLLLFAFGIGSSFPLLLVSLFSQALSYLPRAGSWMVEVKKFFGLMLLATCFYYLKSIIPLSYVLCIAALVLVVLGIYYAATIERTDSKNRRIFKYSVSIAMIALAAFCALHALKLRLIKPINDEHWLEDYQAAYTQARNEHKKLLIEFGADWCSLCNLLERKVLSKIHPRDFTKVVPVKINCGQNTSALCKELMDKFAIQGIPALVLVDPETAKPIKKWGSELIDYAATRFVLEIEQHA